MFFYAENEKRLTRKFISIFVVTLIVLTLCSCDDGYKPAGNGGFTKAMSEKVIDKNIDHKNVENDTNIGLMSIKMNNTGKYELNDTEKLVIKYFDTNYNDSPDYNALQRYPQIYENSQIMFGAEIIKIISSDSESFEILARYDDVEFMSEETENFVVIKGKHQTSRLIIGDFATIYGKNTSVNTYNVDGTSYTVPTVEVDRYSINMQSLYTLEDIKLISRYIFGDNISIRKFDYNKDISYEMTGSAVDLYVCTLENQSNANFSEYVFDAYNGGWCEDLKYSQYLQAEDIEKSITFAADFEHFYLKTFDTSLDVFTIACYDKNLNKIWSREFEQTTSEVYDYTPDHLYVVANGTMYIIDAETGENAVDPKYVGSKDYIRKTEDGILLVQTGTQSDAIMKTDLVGNVKWTANTKTNMAYLTNIQIPNENYIISYSSSVYNEDIGCDIYEQCAMVLQPDGTVVYDAEIF